MNKRNEKINNIIAELQNLRVFDNEFEEMEYFCDYFRLALIDKLQGEHAKYDTTLQYKEGHNWTDRKKYFAFKIGDYKNEFAFLQNLNYIYNIINEYIEEDEFTNYTFNIVKIEGLRDRDTFADLIRGMFVIKEVNND